MNKKLETLLNQDYSMLEEGICFKVKQGQVITMEVYTSDTNELLHTFSTTQVFNTLEENIKSLVGSIYDTEINHRKRYINNYKGSFLARKMKSLEKAMLKSDADRIATINKELVEGHKIAEKYKYEIGYFKTYVSLLYDVLSQELNKTA